MYYNVIYCLFYYTQQLSQTPSYPSNVSLEQIAKNQVVAVKQVIQAIAKWTCSYSLRNLAKSKEYLGCNVT
jgi:hypothetical protein